MKYSKYVIIIGILVLVAMVWSLERVGQKSLSPALTPHASLDDLTKIPEGTLEHVQPTEVVELNDGDTYALEARIVTQTVGNRTIKRLAYNGQIPGPIIKVQKGAKVTINFTNNIDMETALHSHGLRGDYLMDGAVPITPAIPVGESFSYELEFPDTGVFWYHPHVREDYQQELGLYGNFIVEEDGYWNKVGQEAYLMIDDMLENGSFNSETVTHTLMGRFGNQLLINDERNYTLTVTQGETVRAFITNVANARTFDLAFEGAQMKLVGGDSGRAEHETMITHHIIAPAERAVIELYYDTPGTYTITHRGVPMGTVTVLPSEKNTYTAFSVLRSNTNDYADIRAQIPSLLKKSPDKNLRLIIEMADRAMQQMMGEGSENETVSLMGMEMTREQAVEHCAMMPEMQGCEPYLNNPKPTQEPHTDDGIEWEDTMPAMNQMSTDKTITWVLEDTDTKAKNHDIQWAFKRGDLVKVRIYNDEKSMHPMQHPIHFHGQRFVILATDGVANDNLQWKDTALIPTGKTIDILVDMSNPGTWMAHCHIAEHLHSGMMFDFVVE